MAKRPANRIANWFEMFAQFWMGMVQLFVMIWLAK